MFTSLFLNAQQWSGASNTTGDIIRTGKTTIGSATATNNTSVTKLRVEGGTVTYNGTTGASVVTYADGNTAEGSSSASLATNYSWSCLLYTSPSPRDS